MMSESDHGWGTATRILERDVNTHKVGKSYQRQARHARIVLETIPLMREVTAAYSNYLVMIAFHGQLHIKALHLLSPRRGFKGHFAVCGLEPGVFAVHIVHHGESYSEPMSLSTDELLEKLLAFMEHIQESPR